MLVESGIDRGNRQKRADMGTRGSILIALGPIGVVGFVLVKAFQAQTATTLMTRMVASRVAHDTTADLPDGLHIALSGTAEDIMSARYAPPPQRFSCTTPRLRPSDRLSSFCLPMIGVLPIPAKHSTCHGLIGRTRAPQSDYRAFAKADKVLPMQSGYRADDQIARNAFRERSVPKWRA